MHTALAILFVLHALAHLVGFIGCWELGEAGKKAHIPALFFGKLPVARPMSRLIGVQWIVAAQLFIMAAVYLLLNHPVSFALAATAAVFSGILCIFYLPQAWIGLVINLAILAAVIFGPGRT